jgi:hypothetical protein
VVNKAAKAGAADRALIKKQQDAMNKDMQKAIVRSIQIGEAKSKASNQRLTTKLKATKKAMMSQISESVERAANMVFAVVQGGRAKIADNYLSVKAYSAAVNDDLQTYLAKGKGTSLLSIGDFLSSVAAISSVRTKPAKGIGAGAGAVATPFGAKKIKVNSSVSKINGLVNEYIDILTQVKPLASWHWAVSARPTGGIHAEEGCLAGGQGQQRQCRLCEWSICRSEEQTP